MASGTIKKPEKTSFAWHEIRTGITNGAVQSLSGYDEYLIQLKTGSQVIGSAILTGNVACSVKFITSNNSQVEAYYNGSGTWTVTSGYTASLYGR